MKIELTQEDLEDLKGNSYAPLLIDRGAKAIGYKMQGTGEYADYWKPIDRVMTFERKEVRKYSPYIKEGYNVSMDRDVEHRLMIYSEFISWTQLVLLTIQSQLQLEQCTTDGALT